MIYHFLDTSAVLNGALDQYKDAYISLLSLTELENIKTAYNKSEQIKYEARKAVRTIIESERICYNIYPQKILNKLLKQFNFLNDINDHKIICEAEQLGKEVNAKILFLTSDGAQYLLAQWMPHLEAIFYNPEKKEMEEYPGWKDYSPSEQELTTLYSMPHNNTLESNTNEFAKIYENGELKDVLFWTGNEYRNLKYKDMKNPYLNETLKPRNLEQKMAFDLLQNQNIRVKLLTSAWGGGKTLMALTYALEQVAKGKYSKLIFVRNNIIVADTNDIGYLPGDLKNKMSIWGGPLADHLGGQEMLDQLIEDGVIEIFPLSHIRGRSIRNSIVICDECENMNDKLVTLLMSRIEDGSELIFCGDVAQIDNPKFEKNNGIRSMMKNLKGDPLFGMVKLLKSERGPVATMCDKMRPPV